MSVSDPVSRAESCRGDASLKDDDAYDQFLESVKELVGMPFLSGVMQGFVSVAMQRRRERRAARKAAAEREGAAQGMVAALHGTATNAGARMA